MPKIELLIKKIYTNCPEKLKADLKRDKTYLFNTNSLAGKEMIPTERVINIIKIYLYSIVNQSPLNASLYNVNFLIKNEYDSKEIYSCTNPIDNKFKYCDYDSESCIQVANITDIKVNDTFGGVWSLFTIKMNFID